VCRKARQHEPLVSNRGVQIDRQQSNNRAESHDTQGILPYPAYVNKTLKVDIRFFRQEGFSLNEETWVQDIKEKREVYGISQQKLALAAGITRPYLSDIETGKAHPSEALQKAISEALERFNPDNPLEMLFDYVRIRFPTTDVKHIVEDVLRLKLPYFIHEDYGFYSYTEHYYLGDIFILVSPELEKGVLLELKGRGCRQFGSHPLAQGERVDKGIMRERQKMEFLKKEADYIIDTSRLLTRELKTELEKIFVQDEEFNSMYVTILSFGFKYGIPADSDIVMDVRFLPNPYYVEELRPKTGNDVEIQQYVMKYDEAKIFLNKLEDMVTFLIPHYISEGKNQLVISIGCTGGKHRSVTLANELYKRLSQKKNREYGLKIEHRDIGKDALRGK